MIISYNNVMSLRGKGIYYNMDVYNIICVMCTTILTSFFVYGVLSMVD